MLVDGVDVREWNLEALRRNISMIEQDIFLFSRSIAENIAFGKQDATAEEIALAAGAAQADDFIQSFKDGYQTIIGERGVTLSGGQRQRIALGRAFLTDPSILILDDSTSAIDSATEDKIQRAIFTAARGRTTLIITHRLSQIRWADLILVLRKGRLVATGSHEKLMATSEAYRGYLKYELFEVEVERYDRNTDRQLTGHVSVFFPLSAMRVISVLLVFLSISGAALPWIVSRDRFPEDLSLKTFFSSAVPSGYWRE
jgi:ABC-type transport system involved in cytochrome bd biosynthesis fused ATPase/permease subunit